PTEPLHPGVPPVVQLSCSDGGVGNPCAAAWNASVALIAVSAMLRRIPFMHISFRVSGAFIRPAMRCREAHTGPCETLQVICGNFAHRHFAAGRTRTIRNGGIGFVSLRQRRGDRRQTPSTPRSPVVPLRATSVLWRSARQLRIRGSRLARGADLFASHLPV